MASPVPTCLQQGIYALCKWQNEEQPLELPTVTLSSGACSSAPFRADNAAEPEPIWPENPALIVLAMLMTNALPAARVALEACELRSGGVWAQLGLCRPDRIHRVQPGRGDANGRALRCLMHECRGGRGTLAAAHATLGRVQPKMGASARNRGCTRNPEIRQIHPSCALLSACGTTENLLAFDLLPVIFPRNRSRIGRAIRILEFTEPQGPGNGPEELNQGATSGKVSASLLWDWPDKMGLKHMQRVLYNPQIVTPHFELQPDNVGKIQSEVYIEPLEPWKYSDSENMAASGNVTRGADSSIAVAVKSDGAGGGGRPRASSAGGRGKAAADERERRGRPYRPGGPGREEGGRSGRAVAAVGGTISGKAPQLQDYIAMAWRTIIEDRQAKRRVHAAAACLLGQEANGARNEAGCKPDEARESIVNIRKQETNLGTERHLGSVNVRTDQGHDAAGDERWD
ncbi:hypothetical protein B0H17DRAFT_1129571 [Mycena rosella]|uniref:Uncharacterized protein n=1 Tax=Mycena rosella TaxID=1033263 RepID=A0AAD7GKA9_MYCRO|nr:hypothetical protein B0H17DRAFT_1129571 [Mycena rosella]